jgi:hypothetical protein
LHYWPKEANILYHDYLNIHEIHETAIRSVQISATFSQVRRHSNILGDKVARTFNISLEMAANMLQATTQLVIRHTICPIHHRYRMHVSQLFYPRLGATHVKFHTDTFFSSTPSLSRCTMGQMHTNDINYTKFYPIKSKVDATDTLILCKMLASLQNFTMMMQSELPKHFCIKTSPIEAYSPWKVQAELFFQGNQESHEPHYD